MIAPAHLADNKLPLLISNMVDERAGHWALTCHVLDMEPDTAAMLAQNPDLVPRMYKRIV